MHQPGESKTKFFHVSESGRFALSLSGIHDTRIEEQRFRFPSDPQFGALLLSVWSFVHGQPVVHLRGQISVIPLSCISQISKIDWEETHLSYQILQIHAVSRFCKHVANGLDKPCSFFRVPVAHVVCDESKETNNFFNFQLIAIEARKNVRGNCHSSKHPTYSLSDLEKEALLTGNGGICNKNIICVKGILGPLSKPICVRLDQIVTLPPCLLLFFSPVGSSMTRSH